MDDSEKRDKLYKLYRKTYGKGRGAFAGGVDRAFFTAVVGVLIWLTVRARFANLSAALSLTALCTGLYILISHVIDTALFEAHVKRLRAKAKAELEELLLAEGLTGRFMPRLPRGAYAVTSSESVTADDVLEAKRNGCAVIVCAAEPTEKASKLIEKYRIETRSPKEYLDGEAKKELEASAEKQLDDWLLRTSGTKSCGLKERISMLRLLSRERGMRYICTGALLFALSFAVRSALYYRLAASVCFALGTAAMGMEGLKAYLAAKEKAPRNAP